MTEAGVSLAGNLTDDPELLHSEGGIAGFSSRSGVSARAATWSRSPAPPASWAAPRG
jgi:hypothetical protein